MNLDAIIFMFCAWGCTLGLLAFCLIKLAGNPNHSNSEEDSN